MNGWMAWLTAHWVSVILLAGLVAACLYVWVRRKSLFLKD